MKLIIKAIHKKNEAQLLEKSFTTFPLIIGRSPQCDMVLPDTEQFVSSRHLQINHSEGKLSVTDTSSNGTFINSAAVPMGRGTQLPLTNGDHLDVGDFRLQVIFDHTQSVGSNDDPFNTGTPAPAFPEGDNSDPFAALGGTGPVAAPGVVPNRHIDKLEDIGIGPSAWDTTDDSLESLDLEDNSSPAAISSHKGRSADDNDQWAGWLDDIPGPLAANRNPERQNPSMAPPAKAPSQLSPESVASTHGDSSISQLLAAAGLNPGDYASADQNQLAQHIGRILNRSTHSMMLLLRSRDEIKNALHAEVTLLAAQDNNPLKFSISVEEALNRLLQPTANNGFTASEDAIDKALDDIKIHQIAMLEAMRASLQIALSHFEPEALEKRIGELNPLSANLPLARQAKLWDHFKDRYANIKKEALDDFGNTFGDELKVAYEQSVKNMKR